MRRGMKPEVSKIGDKLYGFNLGADFVSEHEWGIKKLKEKFGVDLPIVENKSILKTIFKGKDTAPKQRMGVDKRTTTKFPEKYVFFDKIKVKNKIYWALICMSYLYDDNVKLNVEMLKTCELYPHNEERHIFTAWDEGSFGILVDSEYKDELTELFKAFVRNDVVITLGSGHVFENGGLLLLVRSNIPKEETDKMYEVDMDYANLKKAAEDTKIEEFLKKSDKKWFALSPRWKDDSKKEVWFWLNPMDQRAYNAGWYTVDELKQWAENKGPVIIER